MNGVKSVKQLDEERLHWVAEVAGHEREWEARITELIPEKRIAWKAEEGADNAGVVTFHYIDDNTTRVMLQMDVEPESTLEKAGDKLGLLDKQVEADLERFKEIVEA